MRYLVNGESATAAMTTEQPDPAAAAAMMEAVVIPSLEMLEGWERDGRILSGGILAGRRGVSMVIEADSHDEVNELIAQLPVWPTAQWEVTPLQSFSDRKKHDLGVIERLRGMAGG